MSPQQMADYRAHKDSYFGKIVPVGGKIDDPFELFEWFVETHKWMSRDQLLAKLAQTPNIAALRISRCLPAEPRDIAIRLPTVQLPGVDHLFPLGYEKVERELVSFHALAASCSSPRTPSGQHAAGGRRLSQAVTFGVKTPPVIGAFYK